VPTSEEKVSDQLEGWLRGDGPKTLGSLIELFGERSFAVVFVLLMAIPALPIPTGGVTHVLEVVVMLLALELIALRRTIWLPERLRRRELGAAFQGKFATSLVKRIRWFERYSRPRWPWLLDHRLSGVVFGAVVIALTVVAFVAPPFSGLDTLPALGVVVLSLGVLLGDSLFALAGIAIGALGAFLAIGLGTAVVHFVKSIF
jgi:hypothetical protein